MLNIKTPQHRDTLKRSWNVIVVSTGQRRARPATATVAQVTHKTGKRRGSEKTKFI